MTTYEPKNLTHEDVKTDLLALLNTPHFDDYIVGPSLLRHTHGERHFPRGTQTLRQLRPTLLRATGNLDDLQLAEVRLLAPTGTAAGYTVDPTAKLELQVQALTGTYKPRFFVSATDGTYLSPELSVQESRRIARDWIAHIEPVLAQLPAPVVRYRPQVELVYTGAA